MNRLCGFSFSFLLLERRTLGALCRGLKCQSVAERFGCQFDGPGNQSIDSSFTRTFSRHIHSIDWTCSRDRSARHPWTLTATVFFQWVLQICGLPSVRVPLPGTHQRWYSRLVLDQCGMDFLAAFHYHNTGLCCTIPDYAAQSRTCPFRLRNLPAAVPPSICPFSSPATL